jgi:hypothetical protein
MCDPAEAFNDNEIQDRSAARRIAAFRYWFLTNDEREGRWQHQRLSSRLFFKNS